MEDNPYEQHAANQGIVTGAQAEANANLRHQIASREEKQAGFQPLEKETRATLTTEQANQMMADKHEQDVARVTKPVQDETKAQ